MPVKTRSQDPEETLTLAPTGHEDAMTEPKEPTIADLLKEFKKGNADTQKKLTSIEASISENHKTVEDYIKKNDEAVLTLQGKVSTLETTITTLEATVNTMSNQIDSLRKQAKSQQTANDKFSKMERQLDEDRRRPNIIIEGLAEDKNMHPRQQVTALLSAIGVNIPKESLVTVSRLGPVGKSRRPRHVLVKFTSTFWKQEIFKNVSRAKDSDKWRSHTGRLTTGDT